VRSARFHAEAASELQAEATYYEQHTKGLGDRFAREIESAVKVACLFPDIGSPYKYGTRRVYERSSRSPLFTSCAARKSLSLPLRRSPRRLAIGAIDGVSSNPSIERTSQRPLRALCAAAHVER